MLRLYENALTGTFFSGLDCDGVLSARDHRYALGTLRIALGFCVNRPTLLDIREAVVKQDEHIRGDFLAQAIASAEILINPDFHQYSQWGPLTTILIGLVVPFLDPESGPVTKGLMIQVRLSDTHGDNPTSSYTAKRVGLARRTYESERERGSG